MKFKITLLIILCFVSINAQNLVLNPSFEEYQNCPFRIGFFDKNVINWSIPNSGSTDYYTICETSRGLKNIENYNGYQKAKTGNGYAGIYVYTDKNYREYIQGELSTTLKRGEEYIITFYVSLAEKSTHSVSDLNVLFTEKKIKKCYHSNWCEKNIKPKKATNKQFTLLEKKEQYYDNPISWTKVTFTFIADGFESFFSIGNFKSNSKTNKKSIQKSIDYDFAYYYIDDVSVVNSNSKNETKALESINASENKTFKPEKTYTFKNVLFDFDKAELLNTSIIELDKLYNHLKENKNLNIEVYGHTDNIGLQKRNQELSTNRAKAVSEYLISKGLTPKRIKWFGFGSSKPNTTNDSEETRAQNRRVEFRLISKE